MKLIIVLKILYRVFSHIKCKKLIIVLKILYKVLSHIKYKKLIIVLKILYRVLTHLTCKKYKGWLISKGKSSRSEVLKQF